MDSNKDYNQMTDGKINKKKHDWKTVIMKRYWDYALSFIALISSGVLAFFIYDFNVLPDTMFYALIAILLIVNIIFVLLILIRKMPNWGIWMRRAILTIICGILIFASFSIRNIQTALQAITQPETATTVNVSLITMKNSGNLKLSDLSDKKIGIQNASDQTNSSYVKEELAKESDLKNVTYVEALDYASLYEQLQKGEIDGLIITDSYFKSILKDTYPTIEDDIFIMKSYQKARESDISTSNKDIRYEPFTVYIAGIDEGDDPSIDARSDVNIVLMVNPLANHIEMVSIPRDSYVPNPALNNGNDKLTHLGSTGVQNSMKGLEGVLGFEIDYYVKLNFFSVIDIIDAIGEIEVDVPVSFCEQDENRSFNEEDLICLEEGTQKLNGKQALAFARHRKSYTDVMRGKAQQEIITGIIEVLTTPSGAANINKVMKIAPKSVSTNMPMDQVTNFISLQLEDLKPWTIDSIILENGVDARLLTASMPSTPLAVMLLNQADIRAVFDRYQEMIHQMQFASFSFDLNNLEEDKVSMPVNNNMLWAGMNTSRYEASDDTENNVDEKDVEETPKTPVKKPDTTPPTTPDKPTTPTTPTPTPNPPTDPSKPDDSTDKPTTPETPETPNKPEDGGNSTANPDNGKDTTTK